jgi:hypothetical protein
MIAAKVWFARGSSRFVHEMQYLLTWNCTHIANAALHELGVASGRELVRLAPRPVVTGPPQALQRTGAAAPACENSQLPEATPAAER